MKRGPAPYVDINDSFCHDPEQCWIEGKLDLQVRLHSDMLSSTRKFTSLNGNTGETTSMQKCKVILEHSDGERVQRNHTTKKKKKIPESTEIKQQYIFKRSSALVQWLDFKDPTQQTQEKLNTKSVFRHK